MPGFGRSTKLIGGDDTESFDWSFVLFGINSKYYLSKINVKAGSHVDQIQFVYTNDVDTKEGPKLGGTGGTQLSWTVP